MATKMQSIASLLMDAGFDKVSEGERNAQLCCPMAPYTDKHKSNKETKPSMGIRVTEDDTCVVNCFACKFRSATLEYMFRVLTDNDERYAPFITRARDLESPDVEAIARRLLNPEVQRRVDSRVLSHAMYRQFSGQWHPYLERRGVAMATGKAWNTGFDKERLRVTVPVITFEGELVGAQGRALHNQTDVFYYNYWDMNRSHHLMGMNMAIPGSSAVLVEGFIDMLVVWQSLGIERLNYSVVCAMGSEVSGKQMDLLVDNFDEVILAQDAGSVGSHSANSVARKIGRRIPCRRLKYTAEEISNDADPADLGSDIIKRIRDADPVI